MLKFLTCGIISIRTIIIITIIITRCDIYMELIMGQNNLSERP